MCTLTEIDTGTVLSFLGCRGAVPDSLLDDIKAFCKDVIRAANPLVTYRLFSLQQDGSMPDLGFSLESENVKRLLSGCDRAVIFAVTLGAGVDLALRRYQATDMGKALVFDACANAAVETLCDSLCKELESRFGSLTTRYSPGYGDLALSKQQDFARTLALHKTIGVTLTPSGIMIPQKTVTAIVGIKKTTD